MAACPTCQREGYASLEVRLKTGMKAAGATLIEETDDVIRFRTKNGTLTGVTRNLLHGDKPWVKSMVENLIIEARKP